MVNSGLFLSRSSSSFHHRQHGRKCIQVFLRCPLRLFFHRSFLSTDIRKNCANVLAIPFLVASMSAVLFLICVISIILCCLDSRGRFSSLKLFKNTLYLLMSFGSFVVSDSFFDLLADVSHLGLLLSFHFFSMRAKSS